MGRRSINTTKSGKYMNPTDQARKEARKKELKKNKKQRQMVRAAVLKNKDPGQILEEMEKIDEMEYNVLQPSPLNEKVLRDKRKKLKETFDRVMRLYQTEEPELWSDLKKKEIEYEKKRLKKQQYFESVKHAQSVQIDEIPLPSATPTAPAIGSLGFNTSGRLAPPSSSLPPFAPGVPPSALRKPLETLLKSTESPEVSEAKDRANVPVGPPPNLFHMIELDSEAENEPGVLKKYIPRKKRKSNKKSLGMSGQNIDDFMKEMESVHKKKEKEKEKERQAAKRKYSNKSDADVEKNDDAFYDNDDSKSYKSDNDIVNRDSRSRSQSLDKFSDSDDNEKPPDNQIKEKAAQQTAVKAAPTNSTANIRPVVIPLPPAPSGVAPHMPVPGHSIPTVAGLAPPMMYRPPPMRPQAPMAYGIRMPPGPPSAPRPRPPGIAMPQRMGIRMPPGPPPGMPPRLQQHKNPQQMSLPPQLPTQLPQMMLKDPSKGITTITAKPQIRNLSADVTRFVPSALRVKREETKKSRPTKSFAPEYTSHTAEGSKAATKDDAYKQFMNEMQGLL